VWIHVKHNAWLCEAARRFHDDKEMSVDDLAYGLQLPAIHVVQAVHAGRLKWSLAGGDVDVAEEIVPGVEDE
jgi:hypothetical protein